MTKCEDAQRGIDKLLNELEGLCESAFTMYNYKFNYASETQSLSIRIRITLVSLLRMMIHYGKHLGGFKPVDGQPNHPEDLKRISYLETKESIDLQDVELEFDKEREQEELEHLGPIGFKNSQVAYVNFPDSINKIEQTCKELVTKLYTGENAKYLVGDQKIPEYLS